MAWYNNKEDFAKATYGALDPIYGQGGFLEPVTVIVDPDRTVREEYVAPIVEDIEEVFTDTYENILEPAADKAESYLKWGAIIGVAYLLLK